MLYLWVSKMVNEFEDHIEKKREGKNIGRGQKCRICGYDSITIGDKTDSEVVQVPYPANHRAFLGLYAHRLCAENLPPAIQSIGSPTRCRICGKNEATNGNIKEVSTSNMRIMTRYGEIVGLFHKGCADTKREFVEFLGKKDRIELLKKQIATLHKSYDHLRNQYDPYQTYATAQKHIQEFEAELKTLEAGD